MKIFKGSIKKVTGSHLLVLITQSDRQQDIGFAFDLIIFLLRYTFILTETSQEKKSLKQEFPPQGEFFFQNPKRARYLDPKYSRWISTDPALGEYIPAAGKGTSEEAGKLPGMGGIYNHLNATFAQLTQIPLENIF